MDGDAYYHYQADARGLRSVEDVLAAVRKAAPVYRQVLGPWLPTPRDAAIYEVACGPGILLQYLKSAGYTNLAGSDSSSCQIELARAAGLPVRQADSLAELKSAADATWDCILAIDFIEHLPKDVLLDFLAQCFRTLRPGGFLILRAPNGDSPLVGRNLFNDITHYWAYTTVASRALLEMAGFQRVAFADESLAAIQRHRWLKVPWMRCAQWLLRALVRAATREQVQYLGPSLFVAAWK